MKISVIGCGRWGTFIAWYLDKVGHEVMLYGRTESKNFIELQATRANGTVALNDSLMLTSSLADVEKAEVIVISVGSQGLRKLIEQLKEYGIKNKTFVLCMKGIEISTGKRLSQVVDEYYGNDSKTAVWIGPGHVQDFTRGVPNCMVIDSETEDVKKRLIESFSSELIRFYVGQDMIGNEIGAALKNVIGIAAGMLDGFGLSSLKGALMARGAFEVSRLIEALGGDKVSAYGLCHLGDYEATVFSEFSHNRKFGEMFVKGEPFDKLAEGYYTVAAVKDLEKEYEIEMPICDAIYSILYEKKDAQMALKDLFLRTIKNEFYPKKYSE